MVKHLVLLCRPRALATFSSLFAGTCGETSYGFVLLHLEIALSVPSLQGHVVKLGVRMRGSALSATFSSLFAGTCGETVAVMVQASGPTRLSVPSLQGHVVKLNGQREQVRKILHLSVPSLQGHVVKQGGGPTGQVRHHSFSSLFAGTCGETIVESKITKT